ncbi:MAG: Fe2+ transport system protein [Schlesneria sp.]|nr:Fe2+ transport system protein [Schlesneria sp.]
MTATIATGKQTVLVIGDESIGKSALVAKLTGRAAYSSNFRGSTVNVQTYSGDRANFVDTPGILFASDSESTQSTLAELTQHEQVLVVVKATHLDQDLRRMLPLVQGKYGAVVVTFWDKVQPGEQAFEAIEKLSAESGVPFVPLDARYMSERQRAAVFTALDADAQFVRRELLGRAGWRIEPKPGLIDHRWIGPYLALALLLAPSVVVVQVANTFAAWVDPLLSGSMADTIGWVKKAAPEFLAAVIAGKYGLLTMGPLLFAWAVPTVVLYSLLLAVYKETGLLDRITTSLQPLMRHVGLTGRDLVRVIMGMGCNVPAVIATRNCSACTRGACLHAIGFGLACSYQLGATLAVFAAVRQPGLIWPYLGYLTLTTLIYTRLVSHPQARNKLNVLTIEGRSFLSWPDLQAVYREACGMLREFMFRSLPIFFTITLIASVLDWFGIVRHAASWLGPAMGVFRLPAESAVVLLMASIRKDGLLLLAEQSSADSLTGVQVLTGVYLAGVLLPCLVTVLTIAREQSWGFASKLVMRQLIAAVIFAMALAWGGHWLMEGAQ